MSSSGKDYVVGILADASDAVLEMEGFAGKAGKIAVGVGAAWSAANIGGQMMDSIQRGIDTQAADNMLAAALPPAEAGAAGKAAGDLYRQGLTESLGETNAAVAAVVQNLGGVDELGAAAFGRVTTNAQNLATVMDEDVAGVTSAVASMMRSGLAPDAEAALDIIAVGAQEGVNKGQDLLDTYSEYSVVFAQLGLTGAESLGLLNQGLDEGAWNADQVADALKEFTIRAQEAMTTPIDTGAVQAAQQAVVDATRTAQDAITSGARNVAAAEDNLSSAQLDQRQAQENLTQARRDARQALEDLADEVEGAALSERSAVLAVREAQEALDRARTAQDFDQTDADRAQLNYEQAVYNLEQQRERTADLRREKAAADRAGVEGSEQVRNAHQGVTDASRTVQEAQAGVAQAQQDAARAQADAARQVADANAALVAASTPQLTTMGLAYQKLGLDGEAIGAQVARGGDGAKAALQTVLEALRAVEDPVTQAQLGVQLFGTKWEDMQGALLKVDLDAVPKQLRDTAGAADDVSAAVGDGIAAKAQAWRNKLDLFTGGLVDLDGATGDVVGALYTFGPSALDVVGSIAPMIAGLAAWRTAQVVGAGATGAAAAANVGFAATAWAATWPVLAVVGALALVGLGIYGLIKNFDKVKGWLGEHWGDVLAIITGPFGMGVKLIVDHWDSIKAAGGRALDWTGDKLDWIGDKFNQAPEALGKAVTGLGQGMLGLAFAPAQAIAWMWNNSVGKLGFSLPGWIPGLGGKGFSMPDIPMPKIPKLAEGGITSGPMLALIGDNPGGREVVAPLDDFERMVGGGRIIRVESVLVLEGREVARTVHDHDAREY